VLDGRDIGTVICPNADVKMFIISDIKIKAERRLKDLLANGENTDFETVYEALKQRDERDSNRKDCPLKPAEDAVIIDNSALTMEEFLQTGFKLIEKVLDF
jgi:cytidylate kinase